MATLHDRYVRLIDARRGTDDWLRQWRIDRLMRRIAERMRRR